MWLCESILSEYEARTLFFFRAACVCVFIFFHREGFFRLQDVQDILEGTDQRSWVVNISWLRYAKFHHRRIWKCHISPPKTSRSHPYVTPMPSVCHPYVLACHPYVTRMYSMSSVSHSYVPVCHSYVLVCYPYVTRMYSYVIRMSLVCTRMSSVCHSYVVLLWTDQCAQFIKS